MDYPNCGGQRQSPIDLAVSNSVGSSGIGLRLHGYRRNMNFRIVNAHHTVKMTPIRDSHWHKLRLPRAMLFGVPDHDERPEYELHDIHFHWGGVNSGSEHSLNGSKGAMEIHLVHKRKGVDLDQIGEHADSLLVIAVIVQMTPEWFKHPAHSDKLRPLWMQIENLTGTSEGLDYHFGKPVYFLPNQRDWRNSFYLYKGSLTTPPCLEVVMWVVMRETLWIRPEDYYRIQHLLKPIHEEDLLVEFVAPNVRDTRSLEDRQVFIVGDDREDTIYQHPVQNQFNGGVVEYSLKELNEMEFSM